MYMSYSTNEVPIERSNYIFQQNAEYKKNILQLEKIIMLSG